VRKKKKDLKFRAAVGEMERRALFKLDEWRWGWGSHIVFTI
jgi:hypothetical protein